MLAVVALEQRNDGRKQLREANHLHDIAQAGALTLQLRRDSLDVGKFLQKARRKVTRGGFQANSNPARTTASASLDRSSTPSTSISTKLWRNRMLSSSTSGCSTHCFNSRTPDLVQHPLLSSECTEPRRPGSLHASTPPQGTQRTDIAMMV